MSIAIWTWLQEHSNAELGERLVLFVLSDNADEETWQCWPSVAGIAHRTRLSERQVQRCLRGLEEAGRITIHQGGGRGNSNSYTILKGCQYDTLSGDIKGDILSTKGDILSLKGDIYDNPILSEPSYNRKGTVSVSTAPRPAQDHAAPGDPARPRPSGQEGEPALSRLQAGAFSAQSGSTPEIDPNLAPHEPDTPHLRQLREHYAAQEQRKADRESRRSGQRRPGNRGKVQRNAGGVPATSTLEPSVAPCALESRLRALAVSAGCQYRKNGIAPWVWEELGGQLLAEGDSAFTARAFAKFANAAGADLGFAEAIRAIHQEGKASPRKGKRETAQDAEARMFAEGVREALERKAKRCTI